MRPPVVVRLCLERDLGQSAASERERPLALFARAARGHRDTRRNSAEELNPSLSGLGICLLKQIAPAAVSAAVVKAASVVEAAAVVHA